MTSSTNGRRALRFGALLLTPLLSVLLPSCDAPSAQKTEERARIEQARGLLRKIAVTLDQYRLKNNTYPEDLWALTDPEDGSAPMLVGRDSAITDPWGNLVIYETSGDMEFTLRSLGPDGEEFTDDDLEHRRTR